MPMHAHSPLNEPVRNTVHVPDVWVATDLFRLQ